MYLIMIGIAIVVLLVAFFTWPNPDFKWGNFFGILTVFSVIMSLIIMFTGGVIAEHESLYTKKYIEAELASTGDGSYVLVSESYGTYTFKSEDGSVITVEQGAVEIIPDTPARMIKTEFDTTHWALWANDPEYVLYVPAGGVEGLTDSR